MEKDQEAENHGLLREVEQAIYPDPEIERDVYVPRTLSFQPDMFDLDGMDSIDDQKQFFELLNTLKQQNARQQTNTTTANSFAAFAQFGNSDGSGDPNPLFANLNTNEKPKVPETRLQKFLNTKIHIGLLSIFTYILILFTPFRWNVFLIFLLWEIAEIFILRQHESNSNGIINVLFMLAGISPNKVNIVLKWIQLLNKVLRDVALFTFFFVLSHVCRSYWTGLSVIPLIESNDQSQNMLIIPNGEDSDDVFEHFEL